MWVFVRGTKILLQYQLIVNTNLYLRLFIAPLEHLSDIHLYYNMVSFAWKGMKLENHSRYGSVGFIGLISLFSIMTGVVYSVLSYGASELLSDPSYTKQCAIGFSGVLFALKVVVNNEDRADLQGFINYFYQTVL